MTDKPEIETPVEPEIETSVESPYALNPPMTRCMFSLVISTYDIESLREGLDITALNIGRYGLGAFFVVATNPDTNEQWVVQDGDRIYPMAEWEALGRAQDEDDEDPVGAEAIERIVTTIREENRNAGRPATD